jgi:hypothetical protein
MGLKGIVFTTDVLIGLSLAVALIFLIPLKIETDYPEISFQALSYQSSDLINFLATMESKSFSNTPTIANLLANKIITEEDLGKTLLDLIGSFWYSGNHTIASNITKDVLQNLTNDCFSLQTQNETIYSSCNYIQDTTAVSYRIASGFEIGKPVSGFIARAWATKVRKNTTQIIPFYPEGSGWTANRLEVTKIFSLPVGITIYNATLYVSIHFGTQRSQAQFEQLKVNGVEKKTSIVWVYTEEESSGSEITTAAYGFVDVTNEIQTGSNTIYLAIGTPNYHSHIHPGMRLIVTYSLTQDAFVANRTFYKRYYFDNVIGRTGAWSMISFYVPENSKNVSAYLHLNAKNVDDTKYFAQNATDVKVYVNSGTPFYIDGTTERCYSIANWYCKRDIVGVMNPRLNFNITNALISGTNTVSVFLNSYGDLHWGDDTGDRSAIIYSNPIDDPENSSYVEVSYSIENPLFNYGEIDITKEKLFGGNESNPKNFTFNISSNESRIIESFTHIAQGFSSMIKVYAWFDDLAKNLVFISPATRVVPESAYIRPSIWSVGKNNIELVDVQPGGSISDTNKILPWSSFEYTYLVKGLVGYGNVFNTSQSAIDDARQRLIAQISLEQISAEDIQTECQAVQGIQWLWGPSIFKILSWERK